MRTGYTVGVIDAHLPFDECASDNVGVRVLVGLSIPSGRGVGDCGRGGCG